MSKRTATCLLEQNIIPSVHSGKKTRCYSINKSDVIAFFNDLNLHPEKHAALSQDEEAKPISTASLPTFKYSKRKLRAYYKDLLTTYENDLLTVDQVAEFTGYN